MRVLVIDDNATHRQSAIDTLVGHEVTIVDSFDAAKEILRESSWKNGEETANPMFDAVLTDMMMPMSKETLVHEAYKADEQVPYGFIIALLAAHRGAKFVAMLTDTNHHQGALSAALDELGPSYYPDPYDLGTIKHFTINGAKAIFVHTPFVQKIEKDATCMQCSENPGVCSRCDGTGLNKNPNWHPRECRSCGQSNAVGKCTTCEGSGRHNRVHEYGSKDWGRVLNLLVTGEDAPTYLEYGEEDQSSGK